MTFLVLLDISEAFNSKKGGRIKIKSKHPSGPSLRVRSREHCSIVILFLGLVSVGVNRD